MKKIKNGYPIEILVTYIYQINLDQSKSNQSKVYYGCVALGLLLYFDEM